MGSLAKDGPRMRQLGSDLENRFELYRRVFADAALGQWALDRRIEPVVALHDGDYILDCPDRDMISSES